VGLIDRIRGELIDIVEWTDDTRDTIVWRFPRHENEIKMNAKLVVREGQVAVFVNEGTIADVFMPGTYTLETRNLPVLSTLKGWKYGFESPFKAEVYFVSTRQFTDQKWGTPEPGDDARRRVRDGPRPRLRHLLLQGSGPRRAAARARRHRPGVHHG
jgi:membrane protease subunit (stomatin/prohibitin family)